MPFLTTDDFKATIQEDILNALTKGDATVITDNIARTIDEARSYLYPRYDTTNIFNKEGDERNKYIVRLCLTICEYYIYLTHNPRKITQVVENEFTRAIDTLEKIQQGKINPEGLPLPAAPADPATPNGLSVQWGGDLQLQSSY